MYYVFHSQAVIDNQHAMKDLMARLTERVEVVSAACEEAGSEGARTRIDNFVRYVLEYELSSNLISLSVLVREAVKLHTLSCKATWKQILENEQDAGAVKDTIQTIDESLKTFQVGIHDSQIDYVQ